MCIHIYMYVYIYTHKDVYIYIYAFMCICTDMYICIHVLTTHTSHTQDTHAHLRGYFQIYLKI